MSERSEARKKEEKSERSERREARKKEEKSERSERREGDHKYKHHKTQHCPKKIDHEK